MDEPDLSEEVAGAERSDVVVALNEVCGALLEDEQLICQGPLAGDVIADLFIDLIGPFSKLAELL